MPHSEIQVELDWQFKWGHKTQKKPIRGLNLPDFQLLLESKTMGVGKNVYWKGGHRTYFVDGGNNLGGDTAQHWKKQNKCILGGRDTSHYLLIGTTMSRPSDNIQNPSRRLPDILKPPQIRHPYVLKYDSPRWLVGWSPLHNHTTSWPNLQVEDLQERSILFRWKLTKYRVFFSMSKVI